MRSEVRAAIHSMILKCVIETVDFAAKACPQGSKLMRESESAGGDAHKDEQCNRHFFATTTPINDEAAQREREFTIEWLFEFIINPQSEK